MFNLGNFLLQEHAEEPFIIDVIDVKGSMDLVEKVVKELHTLHKNFTTLELLFKFAN